MPVKINIWSFLMHDVLLHPGLKWAILLGVFLVLLIWTRKNHGKWNSGWLSELIEERFKNAENKKEEEKREKPQSNSIKFFRIYCVEIYDALKKFFTQKIKKDIRDYHLPSLTTFGAVIILATILFFLGHKDVPYGSILEWQKWISFLTRELQGESSANIITITAGLTSIVFALVIFIAESLRDGKNPDLKRVLLRASKLWPLVVFTVLSLLNFIVFKVNIMSAIFPVIIGALSIYSFGKIILYFMNPVMQEESYSTFLKKRIRDNVNESVRERLGNMILYEKVGYDKEIKFEYTLSKSLITNKAENYIFVDAELSGRIVDVNLEELKKLANYLKAEAEKLGFRIYPSELTVAPTANLGTVTQKEKSEKEDDNNKVIYLFKRFGEYIPPTSIFTRDSNTIFAMPVEFARNESVLKHVRGIIPHIFRFSEDMPSSEIFRKEMKGIKDRIIASIKAGALGSIEELRQTYVDLAEIFLETVNQFGGGYSAEQAKKERGNFFEGWNEVRWLKEDIRELIQVASETNNRDIISDIIFLPTAIAIRAFHVKDHFLFQEFLSLHSIIYYLAEEKESNSSRAYMIERSWRFLKELSDFYVEPKIKDREENTASKDFSEYKDFSLFIFRIFQGLIKGSFDKKDLSSYQEFITAFLTLYKRVDADYYPNSKNLKIDLERATTPAQKATLELQLEKQIAKENAIEKISLAKKQVLFALASKIFDKYRQSKDTADKKFFDFINSHIELSVEELTKVFNSCRNFDSEDYWGWDDWETMADGEVHIIDVHSKLDYFYCIKMLSLLRNKTEDEISKIDMPHSRNLAFLAEDRADNSTLISKLNKIREKPEDWLFILDQESIDKVGVCIELIQSIKKKQEHEEDEMLKKVKINPEKMQEFKDKIQKGFIESVRVRPLVKTYNIYQDKGLADSKLKISSFGYNQIDEKAAFLKDWYVHYTGWGEIYGEGMAHSEDQIFFETVVSELTEKEEVESNQLIQKIRDSIEKYGFKNPIIIQSLEHMIEYSSLKGSEYFIDKWRINECPKTKISNLDGFLGVLKYGSLIVPVFDIFVRDEKLSNKIVITDLSELGIWEQYLPIDKQEDKEFVEGIFYLKVIDLNLDTNEREKIIKENPQWLQEHTDPEGYLQQKVIVKFYEKFRFVVHNYAKGVLISVTKTVGNSTTQIP